MLLMAESCKTKLHRGTTVFNIGNVITWNAIRTPWRKWISTAIFQFNFSSSMEIRGFFFYFRKKRKLENSTIILRSEGRKFINEVAWLLCPRCWCEILSWRSNFIEDKTPSWNLFEFSKYYFRFDLSSSLNKDFFYYY